MQSTKLCVEFIPVNDVTLVKDNTWQTSRLDNDFTELSNDKTSLSLISVSVEVLSTTGEIMTFEVDASLLLRSLLMVVLYSDQK